MPDRCPTCGNKRGVAKKDHTPPTPVSKEPYGALALGVGGSVLLAKRCGIRREVLVGLLRYAWNDLSRKSKKKGRSQT